MCVPKSTHKFEDTGQNGLKIQAIQQTLHSPIKQITRQEQLSKNIHTHLYWKEYVRGRLKLAVVRDTSSIVWDTRYWPEHSDLKGMKIQNMKGKIIKSGIQKIRKNK